MTILETDSAAACGPPVVHSTGWLRGAAIVAAMTVLSRILGLARDIAMAKLFGLSPVMDAFTVAFRIPNLFRKLFGEGALATSFIPVFARELQHSDRSQAWRLASAVLGSLALLLTAIVFVGEIGLGLWARQTSVTSETFILIELTALMLPYLILICLASQVGAVLNSVGHFKWPATVPVVLNLIWLLGIWCLTPWFTRSDTQARVLASCVLLSGVLQLLVQWPALRSIGFRFTTDWRTVRQPLRDIGASMLPVVLGLSVTQLNTFSDSLIAWMFSQPIGQTNAVMSLPGSPPYPLQAGAVSALYYGERMYQFPLGVFGVALGTAIFPLLARHAARSEMDQFRKDLSLGLRLVILIGVPASAALVWLSQPIAKCLFERGEFGPADTVRTARIIAAYGCGVWAYCGLLILQRGCYAVGDRLTPLRIGMMIVGVNLTLNLILIWFVAERGLAYSTAFCAMLQIGILMWSTQQRVGRFEWADLFSCLGRTILATGIMSATGIGLIGVCAGHPATSGKLIGLIVPCIGASLTYLASAWLLKLDELWIIFRRPEARAVRRESS